MNAVQIVEAVLFASDAPLGASEIARADPELDEDVVERCVEELKRLYDDEGRAFHIREISEGYQILTRPEFAPYLERFDTVPRPSRLSGPALETLAIIAYRQPIGRLDIEYIRGVNSSGVVRTLVDRGLVDVVGRAEGLGRPLLYGTTSRFLEHFGFNSLEDLPRPEELPVVLRDVSPLAPEEVVEPDEEGEARTAQDGAEAEPTPEMESGSGTPRTNGEALGSADDDMDEQGRLALDEPSDTPPPPKSPEGDTASPSGDSPPARADF